MISLRQTEIDGVPTVWSPVPGPLRATLTLRVGSADETYLSAGISQLLQEVALTGLPKGDPTFVDPTRTVFTVDGEPGEVVDFLGTLTRQLVPHGDQPSTGLREQARRAQGDRGHARKDAQSVRRYGAQGYGLVGTDQIGVQRVGPAELGDWSRRFATRANSVLWLSGPPPAGLRLYLPGGDFQPAPDPRQSIVPVSPAWFTGPPGAVLLDCLVTWELPAEALADVLRGRLIEELRSRLAVAQAPSTEYLRLTGDTARLIAFSDLDPRRQFEGVRPMLTMLEQISAEPGSPDAVRESEIDTWVSREREQTQAPGCRIDLLEAAAWDVLHGLTPIDGEQRLTRLAEVTGEQIATVAREARATLLAQIPPGISPQWQSWRAVPASPNPRFTGHEYRSRHRDARAGQTIQVGPNGITMAGDNHLSVPLDSTVGVLRWSDGGRVLVGADGLLLEVEPTLWRDGPDLVQRIDRLWPAELIADLGSRAPERIPQPAAGLSFGQRVSGLLSQWEFPGITSILAFLLGLFVLVASARANHANIGYYIPSWGAVVLFTITCVAPFYFYRK
jgi:hypothetical protein